MEVRLGYVRYLLEGGGEAALIIDYAWGEYIKGKVLFSAYFSAHAQKKYALKRSFSIYCRCKNVCGLLHKTFKKYTKIGL